MKTGDLGYRAEIVSPGYNGMCPQCDSSRYRYWRTIFGGMMFECLRCGCRWRVVKTEDNQKKEA